MGRQKIIRDTSFILARVCRPIRHVLPKSEFIKVGIKNDGHSFHLDYGAYATIRWVSKPLTSDQKMALKLIRTSVIDKLYPKNHKMFGYTYTSNDPDFLVVNTTQKRYDEFIEAINLLNDVKKGNISPDYDFDELKQLLDEASQITDSKNLSELHSKIKNTFKHIDSGVSAYESLLKEPDRVIKSFMTQHRRHTEKFIL